ncbi:heat shock 70kDa protein 4 [Angomonas deanei]|nr:heat shock 70kDa protein 4 [Angomonas deanei]|eukprot:EPY41246.1 heat shock 70kDa protein 4 [Angomonas deanei]
MSVFGVDFGNLNSTVAITRFGGIDIVTNEVSKRETTTIVSFTDGERFIGEQAYDRYVRNSQNTIFLLKRFIGMRMDDPALELEKRFLTCEIKGDDEGRLMFGVNYCDEFTYFYPEQVLAMLLQRLRSYVNEAATTDPKFPADVRDVVLTVPGYYTADQRRRMYQACEIANINCMSLINEGTASSVDYGIFRESSLKDTEEEAIVVGILDIGYGATDFSVVKFWKRNCKILARTFDRHNGTRDIDYLLYEDLAKMVQEKYKLDVTGNKRARLRMLQAAEKLKYLLSANQTAPLNIENIMDIDINIPSFERATLEALGAPMLDKVRAVIERGFAESGVAAAQFHSIELIGGGCRIPMIKRMVEETFGRAPSFTLNASETTARGCAVVAAMLSPKFQVREFKITELPTYPVMLGYTVENPKTPTTVPFLPEVNKVVSLLGPKDTYPKLLEVTIPRVGPMKIYAFYDPESSNVKMQNLQKEYVIGEWEIGAPSKPQGKVRDTRLRVNVTMDATLRVENAYVVDVFEVEVTEDGKPNPEKPDEPVEKVTVKKEKHKQLEVSVKPNLLINGHAPEAVVKFRKDEEVMAKRDHEIIRTREKKNELESYILDFRPRFAEGGMLADYLDAAGKQKFVKQCDDDEQWLYDDGESADYAEYDKRVQALRAIGDAAFNRHRLRDDVEFFIKGYKERLEAVKKMAYDKKGGPARPPTTSEPGPEGNAVKDPDPAPDRKTRKRGVTGGKRG